MKRKTLIIIFSSTMQSKFFKKKLTKEGRMQSVPRDIGDGDGVMELMLEQAMMTMARWSLHWNKRWH
jgi:hypothetical protein